MASKVRSPALRTQLCMKSGVRVVWTVRDSMESQVPTFARYVAATPSLAPLPGVVLLKRVWIPVLISLSTEGNPTVWGLPYQRYSMSPKPPVWAYLPTCSVAMTWTQDLAFSCLCRMGLSSSDSKGWCRWPQGAESGGQGRDPSLEAPHTHAALLLRLTEVAPGFLRLRN